MRNFRQWGRNHCICSLEIAQDFREAVHASGRHRRLAALEKIIAGETDNWSGPLRSGWTRFILSLLFRNPEALATIKGHIIQMWDEGTKALQADYAARRRAGDPETVEEFLAKHEPNAAQIDAANFLADVIDNDRVGKTVLEMKWSRIDLSKSTHQLLTSNRPINMPLGLADPEAYISLPVSPRILFVLPRPESTCNDCAPIAENCATLLRAGAGLKTLEL